MKLPNRIKVGGHIFKVIFPYRFQERVDQLAQTNFTSFEIRITDVDINGNKRINNAIIESFFDELLHCINYVYNCDDLDDDVCHRFAQGLFQVYVDNFKE